MALEWRGNSLYYYKKEREGNRVVSRYYGKGELAVLISQYDKIERREKEEKAEIQRKNRETIKKIDSELSQLESEIKSLMEAALLAMGFHKTKSREWRLKRNEHKNRGAGK